MSRSAAAVVVVNDPTPEPSSAVTQSAPASPGHCADPTPGILAIEAAIYGQGIALTNEVLVEDAIRSGDLVELMRTDTRFFGYYVSGPTHLWDSSPIQLLRKWLHRLVQSATPERHPSYRPRADR